jgi:predicted RNase H-like nuclease
MSVIAGADWFQGRWVAVVDAINGPTSVRWADNFTDFLAWPGLDLLVIDIPIGLPERGGRSCDTAARKVVKPRASSVFSAPIRSILDAGSHEEACQIWEGVEGKRCSIQVFSVCSLIGDVDQHMSPGLQGRVREGHPELSFAYMSGGSGLEHSKHKPEGLQRRIELLEPHFPDLRAHISGLRQRRAIVDLLDALAMLWTARRVRSGEAISIPEQPQYDSRGLRMEMVA